MSKFYDTMRELGYDVELDRRRPGFDSFIRREEKFDLVILFFFKEKKMKGYVVPKILFTKLEQTAELRNMLMTMSDTLLYLKSLSKYDIIDK